MENFIDTKSSTLHCPLFYSYIKTIKTDWHFLTHCSCWLTLLSLKWVVRKWLLRNRVVSSHSRVEFYLTAVGTTLKHPWELFYKNIHSLYTMMKWIVYRPNICNHLLQHSTIHETFFINVKAKRNNWIFHYIIANRLSVIYLSITNRDFRCLPQTCICWNSL